MIHIVTDSTAQLTPDEIKKNNLTVVPLQVTIDGKTYKDGVDITRQEFSDHLANDKEFPKTSQPSLGQFIEAYEKIQKEDPDASIISIHLTKVLSGTVETARTAAKQVGGEIAVLDSDSTDSGLTFAVMRAKKLADEGKSVAEIMDNLKSFVPTIMTYVFINSFDYMVKGGRASRAVGFISSLIQLKPVIQLTKGTLKLKYKCRGLKKMTKIANQVTDEIINNKDISEVGLSYVDDGTAPKKIAAKIKEARPDIDVTCRLTSPIVMTHVGPGGFGYIFA
ncbi:DegV family protein [Fructilactobacillus fructivorans]|uniref:DegV family protein n=1 Tax=Fructilactobacillus fructivorans TaxID=1614 RepID=A0A0C1PML7_9LACO|nr:DegV family protein [Fructilactobacillus fructivorans]KID41166.1 hypothetical protein LfDm3_1312 [Fructilactobacillus fructivorans]MCT0151536.1 DegV family protein [Fructilactobacillus fructivorans]MCT2867054.1 DegV family protein [Fructilactobacillus fructivorans]MCT2869356.1 DegV family protein [Fructilactobacillus fructivorans]MCT2873608.1 DegV family protein [Fructilactobacillus fructivorans]